MRKKYNVGDILLAPHYNGHNCPVILTIIKCDSRTGGKYINYTLSCSDDIVGHLNLFQEDIDFYIRSGDYIHYKVIK